MSPTANNHARSRAAAAALGAVLVAAMACNVPGLEIFSTAGADRAWDRFYECKADYEQEIGRSVSLDDAYSHCFVGMDEDTLLDILASSACDASASCAARVVEVLGEDFDRLPDDVVATIVATKLAETATPAPIRDDYHLISIEATDGWCFAKSDTDLVPGQTCGYTLNVELGIPRYPSQMIVSCRITHSQLEPNDEVVFSSVLDAAGGPWTDAFELSGRYEGQSGVYEELAECALLAWDPATSHAGDQLGLVETSFDVTFPTTR